jgi:hypothetical protein
MAAVLSCVYKQSHTNLHQTDRRNFYAMTLARCYLTGKAQKIPHPRKMDLFQK